MTKFSELFVPRQTVYFVTLRDDWFAYQITKHTIEKYVEAHDCYLVSGDTLKISIWPSNVSRERDDDGHFTGWQVFTDPNDAWEDFLDRSGEAIDELIEERDLIQSRIRTYEGSYTAARTVVNK